MHVADTGTIGIESSVRPDSTVNVLFPGNLVRVFKIVFDSNKAAPESGLISVYSPLGRALLGKREGDEVEHDVNQRRVKIKVLSVS